MEDGRPGRPNSLPHINNIVSNIVKHPSFQETLNQTLEVQTGISRTQNLTGSAVTTKTHSSPPTVSNNGVVVRPGFLPPAEEIHSAFNRGGSSLQRSAYHCGRSYSSGKSNAPCTARNSTASSSNTSNASRGIGGITSAAESFAIFAFFGIFCESFCQGII